MTGQPDALGPADIEPDPDDELECPHDSWEVQGDGSGICNDCGEEVGGAGSNPVPGDPDWPG